MRAAFTATAGRIAEMCGGTLICGDPDARVTGVTTDSREAAAGDLFVPIRGERFDGHDFIGPLAASGAVKAFLTMRDGDEKPAEGHSCACIRCDDTLAALGRLAASHRISLKPRVVGITGTNGKTTTKEMLWAILDENGNCLRSEKNYNNEIGVPCTLLGLSAAHRYAVIEMGMNHAGEIDRLARIALPDIAVITNVGEGHLEFLGSVENVGKAKAEIMNGMRPGARVFINTDSAEFEALHARSLEQSLRPSGFGLDARAELHPDSYALTADEIRMTVRGQDYTIPLYGVHNVYNALAALAVAFELGVPAEKARASLASFRNVDMRGQVVRRGYTVINDTYNSNPLSTRYALMSAREIFPRARKVAVLSDMKELGAEAPRFHRETGAAVAAQGFQELCTWGELAGEIARGARDAGMNGGAVRHFDSKDELAEFLARTLKEGDVVLVKGSRSMKMEEVVERLLR